MVRSRAPSIKSIALAICILALCAAGLELGLHVYDACGGQLDNESGDAVCSPSWTMHHALKPGLRIVGSSPDSGAPVAWRTNSLGMRGPEVEVPKPAGVYRIVCLGDESTLAAETPQRETFCGRLQDMLRAASPVNVEVINAGCPQYGPLLSYLQLRHALLSFAPDLVVYNFDMSDVADDHSYRRWVRLAGSQPLFCPHPDLERASRGSGGLLDRLLTWRQCKRGLCSVLSGDGRPDEAADIDSRRGMYAWLRDEAPDWAIYIDQTLESMAQISAACRSARSDFVLAAVPCPWQVSADASNAPGVRERVGIEDHVLYASRIPFETLAHFAKREGIAFCDASPAFRRAAGAERLYYENAPRFSPGGHDLYARVLGGFVIRNVPGPWGATPSGVARPDLEPTAARAGDDRAGAVLRTTLAERGTRRRSVETVDGTANGPGRAVSQSPGERNIDFEERRGSAGTRWAGRRDGAGVIDVGRARPIPPTGRPQRVEQR